jgi:hypothetical protein
MKKIVLIPVVILVFFSCKKYPDGPLLTLRTKTARITGEWKIDKYIVNNVDSVSINSGFYSSLMDFTCDKSNGQITSGTYYTGKWYFEEHKNKIRFDINPNTSLHPGIFGYVNQTWEIRRLTNKEFWLSLNYYSLNYEIKLIKTEDHG